MAILPAVLASAGANEEQAQPRRLSASETFAVIAELGAILLLFDVGLESTPKEMLAVGLW